MIALAAGSVWELQQHAMTIGQIRNRRHSDKAQMLSKILALMFVVIQGAFTV